MEFCPRTADFKPSWPAVYGQPVVLLLLRQCDGDIPVADPAVVIALEVNRPRLALVAVERAASHARDLLFIDQVFAVEAQRPLPADERDVITLPLRIELGRLGRSEHA